MTYTLIIDTSTEKSLIAVAKGENIVVFHYMQGMQSSELIGDALEECFRSIPEGPDQLKAVAVTTGPGSFTGIRVGVALAKGIAFAKQIPLVGICSLMGFVSEKEGKFASLIDAKTRGVFVLLQERREGEIFLLSEPILVSKESLNNYLIDCPTRVGPMEETAPSPTRFAQIAEEKLLKGEIGRLELLY